MRVRHALPVLLVLLTTWSATAEAQRRPSSSSRTLSGRSVQSKTTISPIQYAAASRRRGTPAGPVALALARTHRLASFEVARTMIRAGYPGSSVGEALVTDLEVAPERAAEDLERAGVSAATTTGLLFRWLENDRVRVLRALRLRRGSRQAIAIARRSAALEQATPEETAEEMADAGYALGDIIDTLMNAPYDLSAEEVLALFLELNLGNPTGDPAVYDLLREKGLTARDALVAAKDAGMDLADAAGLLAAAGWSWDVIADALLWMEGNAERVIQFVRQAGAPLETVVEWAVERGGMGAAAILEKLQQIGEDPLEVAAALVEAGIDAAAVALGLQDLGTSIQDIVGFLQDLGLSAEQIAQILLERMSLSVAEVMEIMITIMELNHETAMAIIENLR